MQTTQGNMLQSLRAAEAFIDGNAATLTGVVSTGARQRLTGAIGELAAHACRPRTWAEQPGTEEPYLGAARRDGRYSFLGASVRTSDTHTCTQRVA